MNDIQALKLQAAEAAVNRFIQSDMIIGLGVGSTAIFATRAIGEKLKTGALHNILAIPCARQTEDAARELGIPLTTLQDHPVVDVTIDGADEVDPQLNLIKGGGGALLREKIVAQATRREVIVIDESKQVPVLGTSWALPVEVVPFGWGAQAAFLKSLGGDPQLRRGQDGAPFQTDEGNYILDCQFGQIQNAEQLAIQLNQQAGIVEHGLFLGLASVVIVARQSGIQQLERPSP